MSIARIAYYFDVEGFRSTIKLFLEEMNNGNFANLRKLATEIGKNNQHGWQILEHFHYTQDDLEQVDTEFDTLENRVGFWIDIIMAKYCISDVRNPIDARTMALALQQIGVESELMLQVEYGRPFGSLLLHKIDYDAILNREYSNWPFWCKQYGVLGWLNWSDCARLLEIIKTKSKASEPFFIEQSNNIIPILSNIKQMFNTAVDLKMGLLLGVSD